MLQFANGFFVLIGAPELAYTPAEAKMLRGALEKFGEAWFPDQDGSVLPPKVVALLGLVAALGMTTAPKLIWLKSNAETLKKRRSKKPVAENNVVQMQQPPQNSGLDPELFRGI